MHFNPMHTYSSDGKTENGVDMLQQYFDAKTDEADALEGNQDFCIAYVSSSPKTSIQMSSSKRIMGLT